MPQKYQGPRVSATVEDVSANEETLFLRDGLGQFQSQQIVSSLPWSVQLVSRITHYVRGASVSESRQDGPAISLRLVAFCPLLGA